MNPFWSHVFTFKCMVKLLNILCNFNIVLNSHIFNFFQKKEPSMFYFLMVKPFDIIDLTLDIMIVFHCQ